MILNRLTIFIFVFFIAASGLNAQIYDGENASQIFEGAKKIRYTERSTYPNYLGFNQIQSPKDGDIVGFVHSLLQLQLIDYLLCEN